MTLGAAALALAGVLSEISLQEEQRKAERQARLSASRAVLPLVLSELVAISNNHLGYEIDRDVSRKDHDWVLSNEAMSVLRECIEFSTGSAHETLIEIPAAYQILMARGHDLNENLRAQREMDKNWLNEDVSEMEKRHRFSTISSWASFFALTVSLFHFARGTREEVERAGFGKSCLHKLECLPADGNTNLSIDPVFRDFIEHYSKNFETADFNDPFWILRG